MGTRRGTRRVTRVPAYAFTPKSISGLVAWYRADLGITIGTGVSVWADQSGTGDANKNLAQATGTKQPTVNAVDGAYGGRPTLSFARVNAQLLASATWAVALAQPCTIFCVGNNDSAALGEVFSDSNSAVNRLLLWNNSLANNVQIFGGSANIGAAVANTSNPQAMVGVYNGASSSVFASAKTPIASGSIGTNTLPGLTIGADETGGSNLNGKVAEWGAYSGALAASQIAQLLSYLGARYAITIGA